MSNARKASNKDPVARAAWSSRSGLCQATLGEWGNPLARPCLSKVGASVWVDDAGAYVVLCRSCRIKSMGYTASEKAKERERRKAAQMKMFTVTSCECKGQCGRDCPGRPH